MFFLLRMAFWLGLVCVLLPTDKTSESTKLPHIETSEAISAATAAVSDMSGFCSRQPTACQIGGQATTVIGARAQSGARKVYQFITDKKPPEGVPDEKKAPDHTGSIMTTENSRTGLPKVTHNTLTQEDLQMEWQTPAPETGQ